jgi:hypothetical protein
MGAQKSKENTILLGAKKVVGQQLTYCRQDQQQQVSAANRIQNGGKIEVPGHDSQYRGSQ